MDAFIKAISYYLPEKIVTNEQLVEEFPEWSVEKIAKKVGIEIMKFFHRHQTFKHLFCIFREQDKEKLFKEIKDINENIISY